MLKLFSKALVLVFVALVSFASQASSESCLSEVSNWDLWKEYKARGLSDKDKMGKLSVSCSGSNIKIEIVDERGKTTSKDYSFPTRGVESCAKYREKAKQGYFFNNELVSYCGGSRCYSVKANADGTFAEQYKDFTRNASECGNLCEAWAKTAHGSPAAQTLATPATGH
jgi:hypothetical protein